MEKENSKTKLIKTASRLFQQQGYHGTGLNQITKESGAPKGSLYYHFPNGKEELAIASVQLMADSVSARIKEGLHKHENAVIAIQSFIEEMANVFERNRCSGGVPIAAVALETALLSEPLREACQAGYDQFESIFAEKLIASGYESKRAQELAVVLNSMVEGAFLLSFTKGNTEPLLAVSKHIPALLA